MHQLSILDQFVKGGTKLQSIGQNITYDKQNKKKLTKTRFFQISLFANVQWLLLIL